MARGESAPNTAADVQHLVPGLHFQIGDEQFAMDELAVSKVVIGFRESWGIEGKAHQFLQGASVGVEGGDLGAVMRDGRRQGEERSLGW